MKKTAILLITCPDRKGIVAAVGEFLYRHDANILHADQHQDAERKLFLMRVEWDLAGFALDLAEFPRRFAPLADRFEMRWRLERSDHPLRVALFVSKYDHCLMDLLYRHHTGELPCDIPLIVSNHADAEKWAAFYKVPFHLVPVAAGKEEAERKQLDLLAAEKIDLVVLARYMQVLSREFVGARPYHRAFDRGVKLIGATSHYATEDLDEGPIIEQDVVRISHRDGLEDLLEKGRDLEKVVLSR